MMRGGTAKAKARPGYWRPRRSALALELRMLFDGAAAATVEQQEAAAPLPQVQETQQTETPSVAAEQLVQPGTAEVSESSLTDVLLLEPEASASGGELLFHRCEGHRLPAAGRSRQAGRRGRRSRPAARRAAANHRNAARPHRRQRRAHRFARHGRQALPRLQQPHARDDRCARRRASPRGARASPKAPTFCSTAATSRRANRDVRSSTRSPPPPAPTSPRRPIPPAAGPTAATGSSSTRSARSRRRARSIPSCAGRVVGGARDDVVPAGRQLVHGHQ